MHGDWYFLNNGVCLISPPAPEPSLLGLTEGHWWVLGGGQNPWRHESLGPSASTPSEGTAPCHMGTPHPWPDPTGSGHSTRRPE